MKVLMINAVWKTGSTGRNLFEMKSVMESDGFSVLVAATHLQEQTPDFFRIGSPLDWKLHGLFSRLLGTQGNFSKNATKRLCKWICKEKPEVVDLHNLHGNYIHLPMLLDFLAKEDIPTVVTLHDCWFYTGKCTHYTVVGCDRWMTGCHDCPQLGRDNKSWFFDRTPKMWKDKLNGFSSIPRLGVIGVSDWILNEAKKSPFFSNAVTMEKIYNWVDLETFRPGKETQFREENGLRNHFLILGAASSWNERKGLNRFIQLARECSEDERVILVGKTPDGDYPERLIRVGSIRDVKTLAALYNTADVFCQLSAEESFGKVIAEALACGTPVVAWRATASPELVSPECGFVVEGDREMQDAIATIRANGKASYSAACRAYAERNFSMKEQIRQQELLFEKLVKS